MRKSVLLLLLCSNLCFADTLIMRDGTRHDGMLESTNDKYVIFSEGGMPHRYSRNDVRSVEFNSANGSSDTYGNSRDNRDSRDDRANRELR